MLRHCFIAGLCQRIVGKSLHENNGGRGMAAEVHRNSSRHFGRRRSPLEGQKAHTDNARGTRYLLHALARHNR